MAFQNGGQHIGRIEVQDLLSQNLLLYVELTRHKLWNGLSLAVPARAPYLLAGILAVLLGALLTPRLGSRLGAIFVGGGICLEAIEFSSILAEVAKLDPSSVLHVNEALLDAFDKEHAEEGHQVRAVYQRDLAALRVGEFRDEDTVSAADDEARGGGTAT